MRILRYIPIITVLLCTAASAQEKLADWIGIQPGGVAAQGSVVYHKTVKLDFKVDEAYLKFTCYTPMDYGGTSCKAFVNGIEGANGSYWQDAQLVNVSNVLTNGDNLIDIEVNWTQDGTSGPIVAKLVAHGKDTDGNEQSAIVRSDDSWVYFPGTYSPAKTRDKSTHKKVAVIGSVNTWQAAQNPMVLPKLSPDTVVGVTDVKIKGGNAGSMYQFNTVRDCGDKFYFLKPLGYTSIEDYIYGQSIYQYPGVWSWGYDKQIAHNHEITGFNFTVYPWVWIPAEWYRKQENPPMVRCIEHGREGFGISLWSPLLLEFNEKLYSELGSNFGDSIRAIYPGIYGDFGETQYMAGWNTWLDPKPEHAHAGFWVGDDLAKQDFRDKMLSRYADLDSLNRAWGTAFKTNDEIAYPKLDGSAPRRYALDFIDWYYDCMTDFTAKVCEIAKKHFPLTPIAPKLGCPDENPMWGQDNSAIPEALAKIGVGVRSTHGSSPNFAVRRISSACKLYGNRFETETASGTNRKNAAKKFFIDASCGCAEVFEYPDAMLRVADIFSTNRRWLRGEHSITDIALFFPTSWHRCNLRKGYPPRLVQAAEEIRDLLDFDVIDENMALDGALANYRVLAMFDGNFIEQAAWDAIRRWIEAGGTLVMLCDQLPFTNIEGGQLPPSELMAEAESGEITRQFGKGRIIAWAGDWENRQNYYNVIHNAAFGETPGTDSAVDNVWTSLFKNQLLFLNNSDHPVTVSGNIPESQAKRFGLVFDAKRLMFKVEVPPNATSVHFLDKPFAEMALECEAMKGAEKFHTSGIGSGCGQPGFAVRIEKNGRLSGEFRVQDDAKYAFAVLADPVGEGRAFLRVDGRQVAEIKGPSGPHKFMYPLAYKIKLRRGRHSVELRFEQGAWLADKIMLTTDTDLAGFAYGFTDPKADQIW